MSSFKEKIDKVFENIDDLKEISARITKGFITRVNNLDMHAINKVYSFKTAIVSVKDNLPMLTEVSKFAKKFDFQAFKLAHGKLKHMPDDISKLTVIVPEVKEVYVHLDVIRKSLTYLQINSDNLPIFKKAAESKTEATKLAKLLVQVEEKQVILNKLILTTERQANALNYANEVLGKAEKLHTTARESLKQLEALTIVTKVTDAEVSSSSYDSTTNRLTIDFAKPLSIKGDKGDDGKGLLINKIGTLQDRNLYNKADIGFIYLAADAQPKPTFYIKSGISYDQWSILEVPHA